MVAQQTLTLYVWVRALDPQPTQRTPSGVLFALAGDLFEHSSKIACQFWIGCASATKGVVCLQAKASSQLIAKGNAA